MKRRNVTVNMKNTTVKFMRRAVSSTEFCSVPKCTSSAKFSATGFHCFPADAELRAKWEVNIRRERFTVTSRSRVCSRHFLPEDVNETPAGLHLLRKGALPVLFDWNDYKIHQRASVWERRERPVEAHCADQTDEDGATGMETCCDHDYCTVPEPAAVDLAVSGVVEMQEEIRKLRGQMCASGVSRNGSANSIHSFKAADLVIERSQTLKTKPDPTSLAFGTVFADHMLTVEWSGAGGWGKPLIKPFGNLSMHPACSALHYAVQLFEGMKAYRGPDDRVRLFRPMLNMQRMVRSADRACLPAFDRAELLECIRRLVELDQDWVPWSDSASLYIRPTLLGTEPSLGVKRPSRALLYVILSPVGSYFSSGAKPVSLWADAKYIRAWRGGTGDCKMGGNYGGSIYAQYEAVDSGCEQVLWLYGDDHRITEVGTMNLFLFWANENGELELATPPLDGIILPGVTRQSILELTRKWGEFKVTERHLTMSELRRALEENRVREMFGSGTACVVSPVGRVLYQGQSLHIPSQEDSPQLAARLRKELTDIQYGRTPSDWTFMV